MTANADRFVVVGTLGAPSGVKGWIKVNSSTQPVDSICDYSPCYIKQGNDWSKLKVVEMKPHNLGVIALIEGYSDRDKVRVFTGKEVAIKREQLPEPQEREYYWTDLEGLTVKNKAGAELGHIDHLLNTGASDILVIEGEKRHLVPFIWNAFVLEVDLEQKTMLVDWEPEIE